MPALEPGPEPVAALEWDEEDVRSVLEAQGVLVHSAIGVAETDWLYTQAELRVIARSATRLLNHYPVTRAAAAAGPQAGLSIALAGYVVRSTRERRAVLRALEQAEPEPVSGRTAPAGTGPPEPTAEDVPPPPPDVDLDPDKWSPLQ